MNYSRPVSRLIDGMNKPKVIVLLATYNGEKYLREQIDSILAQKDVDIFIKASDDRSTDNTQKIYQEYKQKYSNFDYYINENNKGFARNFLDLYYSIENEEFDYCAFADQDDFWLDNKLIEAIKLINKNQSEKGCFYCSNLRLADENLKEFGMQEGKAALKANKYSFIASNIATGCTTVIDHKFYNQSLKYKPDNVHLHDYWLFLVAIFTANYVYDFNGYILYRQHSNNQIGSNKKFFTKYKWDNFMHPKHSTTTLLKELINGYKNEIDPRDLEIIKMAAFYRDSFKKKCKLLFTRKIKKRTHNFLFKLKVLLNKY